MSYIENSEVKRCSTCKKKKPATVRYFYRHKNSKSKDGLSYRCKKCASKLDKKRYNINKTRRWILSLKYGLSPEQYDEILKSQNFSCKICRSKETGKNKFLSVDHNHKTGKIRGLLCDRCNRIIGFCHDNPLILMNAAKYLRKEI